MEPLGGRGSGRCCGPRTSGLLGGCLSGGRSRGVRTGILPTPAHPPPPAEQRGPHSLAGFAHTTPPNTWALGSVWKPGAPRQGLGAQSCWGPDASTPFPSKTVPRSTRRMRALSLSSRTQGGRRLQRDEGEEAPVSERAEAQVQERQDALPGVAPERLTMGDSMRGEGQPAVSKQPRSNPDLRPLTGSGLPPTPSSRGNYPLSGNGPKEAASAGTVYVGNRAGGAWDYKGGG